MSCLTSRPPGALERLRSGAECAHRGTSSRPCRPSWWLAGLAALLCCVFALHTAGAQNLTAFALTALNTASSAQTVTVTANVAGTVNTVEVLTWGQQNLDFTTYGSNSCAGANLAVNNTCQLSVIFTPLYPGVRNGAVVLVDSSNNVLGTEYLTGTGLGAVGVMVPGTMQTAVGSGEWTPVNDDVTAAQANLDLPSAVVVDGAGNIYIADSAHNSVREVYASGSNKGLIETICGSPTGQSGYSGDGGHATDATLSNPQSIAIDGAGNLYIADTGNSAIRKIDAFSGNISSVVNHEQTTTAGFSGDGGAATNALLNTPYGITVDAAGDLYVADSGNQRIREVTASNGIINTVVGTGYQPSPGVGFYSGDGGSPTSADLNVPYAVAFDAAGNMYIPDSGNNRVRIVSNLGMAGAAINTFAGNGAKAYTGDGAAATLASLYSPEGVVVDPAGNVYIADNQNDRVRKVSSLTGYISTIAGPGAGKYGGDGGPANEAGIYGPQGLFLDGMGNLYIADFFDQRIRWIQSNLVVLTFTPGIYVDSKSTPQVQSIENDGNAAMTFTSIAPDLNAAVDAPLTTCSISSSVSVDAICNVGAEFAPTEVGNPIVGNIDLAGNEANTPLDVQVSGESDPLTSTTTTLSATPASPVLFGTNVTMTASVLTGTGTLGGNVTFMDGTTTLKTVALAANGLTGSASFSTKTLTVGPHSLTAVYDGDGVHGTSTSAVVTVNVLEATTVALVSSQNPVLSGNAVSFTATVSSTGGGSAPTGTVVFKDGTTNLGSVTLASSVAVFTTSTLTPPGAHSITAAYSGDSENQESTSAALSQTVQGITSVTVAGSPNPGSFGSSLVFTATVTGNGGTPGGTVNFTIDGSASGSPTLSGGAASVSTSALAVGTHTVVATYNGDTYDTGATSAAYTETVQKATAIPNLVSALNPSASGQAVGFTVTVTGGTTSPTGTVNLVDGGTSIASSALTHGIASFSITTLAVGTHTMTAVYNGDGNYNTSTSSVLSQKVLPNTVAAVSSSADPSIAGKSVTVTVTVTGASPTGSVTLKDGTQSLASLTLAEGIASFPTSSLAVGTHSLSAVYYGDANNAGTTSATYSQVVNQATTTTVVNASANPLTAGKSVSFTATVTGNGATPTGNVTFYSGATALGSSTLNASGVATYTTSNLAVGIDSISAVYAGDGNDGGSTSASYSLSVIQATSTVNLVSSLNPATALQPVTFTATVTGSGGIPTGQVIFSDGGTTLATVPVNGSGVASYSTSNLAVGQHSITAAYQGDADDGTASASLTETIQPAITAIQVVSSLNPSTVGAGVTLTATISGATGTPTGTVTFQDGGTTIGTVSVAANGTAAFNTSALTLGQHSITVSYSGDANNAAAKSATLTQIVQESTATTLVSSKDPSIGGSPVTFTATVVGSSQGIVTGTVTFKSDGSALGSATLNGEGVAAYTTSVLPVGVDAVTAVYSGDALNVASTSPVLTQTVRTAVASTTLSSSNNPSFLGANVTFTATVAGTGGIPTGSVAFRDGSTTLATVNLNSAGIAAFSIATLAVGVHPITASYSGDQYDQANISAVVNQTVQAHVSVTVTSSSNPVLAATPVTFTASVNNGTGAAPTGTLALMDGTTSLAEFTVPASGTITFSTSTLAVGQHSITAVYGGDTDDAAASSSVLTQVIQAIPTKTTLGASPTSLNTGQQVSLTAAVFSGGSVPITGTVSFQNGSTVIGSATLSSSGTATITPVLATGNYNIIATYSGDAVNASSASPSVAVAVTVPVTFQMALNPSTVTMATKQYSTATLTLTSTHGFTDDLGLGCASLPASVTCSFSQDSINLPANGSATVQVTIDTSSPLTSGGQAKNVVPGRSSPAVAAAWIFPGSALFGLLFWLFRKKHNGIFGMVLIVLLSGAAFTISGCGGLDASGAAPGTYTFQVTATGAKTGTNGAVALTLTVN